MENSSVSLSPSLCCWVAGGWRGRNGESTRACVDAAVWGAHDGVHSLSMGDEVIVYDRKYVFVPHEKGTMPVNAKRGLFVCIKSASIARVLVKERGK